MAHIVPQQRCGTFLRRRRRRHYGCSDSAQNAFLFFMGGTSHDTGAARKHRSRPQDGRAVHPGARLLGVGGRRDTGGLFRSAPGAGGGRAAGLRRPAADAVLRGHAPPRAAVPHAGHGDGLTAAGLAEYLHIPHGGAVRRHGLRPQGVPAAGQRPHHQRHHEGVHVLIPPHGGHMDLDG